MFAFCVHTHLRLQFGNYLFLQKNLIKITITEAFILAQNAPQTVWRPSSTRTRWGSLQRSPRPLLPGLRWWDPPGGGKESKGEGGGERWRIEPNFDSRFRGDRSPCTRPIVSLCRCTSQFSSRLAKYGTIVGGVA